MPSSEQFVELIQNRVSVPQLTGPGPTDAQLAEIMKAALRAPDHARLRPWRYQIIKSLAQSRLGELFAESQLESNPQLSPEMQAKYKKMPTRAPILIAAICQVQAHDKVPDIEQLLSTGAGIQNLLLASYAMGFGAIWRTGVMVEDAAVRKALSVTDDEVIVGLIYLGHANCKVKDAPKLELSDFVTELEL